MVDLCFQVAVLRFFSRKRYGHLLSVLRLQFFAFSIKHFDIKGIGNCHNFIFPADTVNQAFHVLPDAGRHGLYRQYCICREYSFRRTDGNKNSLHLRTSEKCRQLFFRRFFRFWFCLRFFCCFFQELADGLFFCSLFLRCFLFGGFFLGGFFLGSPFLCCLFLRGLFYGCLFFRSRFLGSFFSRCLFFCGRFLCCLFFRCRFFRCRFLGSLSSRCRFFRGLFYGRLFFDRFYDRLFCGLINVCLCHGNCFFSFLFRILRFLCRNRKHNAAEDHAYS